MRRVTVAMAVVCVIGIASSACATGRAKIGATALPQDVQAKLQATVPPAIVETELQAAARKLDCVDDGRVRKKTPLHPQENSYWCWAASDQMIESFFERTVKQCKIANEFCARKPVQCTGPGCCRLPADCCVTPEACHVPGWPPFERRKIGFARVPGPLTAEEVVSDIACIGRPFLFAWQYSNGGGHIMAAVGFVTVNGQDFLLVNDPWPPNKGKQDHLSYSEFKKGLVRHWDDFFLLEERP